MSKKTISFIMDEISKLETSYSATPSSLSPEDYSRNLQALQSELDSAVTDVNSTIEEAENTFQTSLPLGKLDCLKQIESNCFLNISLLQSSFGNEIPHSVQNSLSETLACVRKLVKSFKDEEKQFSL